MYYAKMQTIANRNNKRIRMHGHCGFSLLEVIIALGILGIVLLPFLGFVSYRLSQERQSDDLIRAIEIARAEMELVMASTDIIDSENIVDDKFLVKITALDGDKYDEPKNLLPLEIYISVSHINNNVKLIELHGLK